MASSRDMVITAAAPLIWGTTYIISTNWLPHEYPLFIAAMRALPTGLALLALVREVPRGAWWWRSGVLGLCNIGLFFALLFVSAVRLPGGIAAAVGAIQPLLVVGIAWGIAGERPRPLRVVLALLGLVGVACLVLTPAAALDGWGVLAGIGAAGAMGFGTVLGKRWHRPVGLLTFTGWQLIAGGIVLLPAALLVEGVPQGLTASHWWGFFYLAAVNTGLAYVLWFRGVERLPTAHLPLLGLLSPLMAVTVGVLVLHQQLTWAQWSGVALILSSVLLSQRRP